MSLEIDMKLQDLYEQENKYWEPRTAILKEQRNKAANEIKKAIFSFFEGKGFVISGSGHKFKATYKSGVEVDIDTKDLETPYVGSDGICTVKYKNQELIISYLVSNGNLPQEPMVSGRSKEDLDMKKIKFYEETLLPALDKIGVSDLDGSYTLISSVTVSGTKQRKKQNSVDELLSDFFS
ncbi:TPA: hypothetical protein RG697_000458 [Morganella morganii]|uniref:hypothetical protein n=1 Tax=Morganella morganii TaxID=582 RepID=UPI001BD9465B|nr:hypothetical protein [Morganella morganii]MBT0344131.1 hypothetical protein [Morganella morganii subsp. morganii]HDU8608889.1 hypothetical protein [Morganella morganii]